MTKEKQKYQIAPGKEGTSVTLNIEGLPNFVILSNELPEKVLGWLSRNTNLVIENQ